MLRNYPIQPNLRQILSTSKSLPLMLLPLLLSTVTSLFMSGLLRVMENESHDYLGVTWLEALLTSWAILFPIAYILLLLIQKITDYLKKNP